MTLKEVTLWRSFFIGYIGEWWCDEKRIHMWSMCSKVSSHSCICLTQSFNVSYIFTFTSQDGEWKEIEDRTNNALESYNGQVGERLKTHPDMHMAVFTQLPDEGIPISW